MSNFYNTSAGGGTTSNGGFYNNTNSTGDGHSNPPFQPGAQQQQQSTYNYSQQQHQQQQPAGNYPNQGQQQQQTYPGQWQQQQQPNYGGSMPMQGQQQQQQQQQQPWAPPTAASMVTMAAQAVAVGGMSNDKMLEWAMKNGTNAWQSGGASMIPGFDRTMQSLRTYFAVDNRYVQVKMKKILFPFLSKNWKRTQIHGPGPEGIITYALPNSDENAPDLYLPSMSLITYCLLCALSVGAAGEFEAEVIADVTAKCFGTQVLEVLIIRFGFYMMQASVPLLDLFSYTGYKYLGLTVNILSGMAAGSLGYGRLGFYVTFLWTALAASFFMLKTMSNNIPPQVAAAGPKREVMVLSFAVSQAASMWFVSQTKFL